MKENKFFLTIDKETGNWERQGYLKTKVAYGLYLVQYFSALTGFETNCELVPVEDMVGWLFFKTDDELRRHAEMLNERQRMLVNG